MSDDSPKWPPNVPHDALCIFFAADNNKCADYYLWHKCLKGGIIRWFWYALGNDGTEDSAFEATYAARNWIRDGNSTIGLTSKSNSSKTTNSGE